MRTKRSHRIRNYCLIGLVALTGMVQVSLAAVNAAYEIQTKSFQKEAKSKDGVTVLRCSYQYPQVKITEKNKNHAGIQAVNHKIEAYAIQRFQERCTEANDYTSEFIDQIVQGDLPREWLPFTIETTYEMTLNHKDYLSFLNTNFEWLGGAHPNTDQTGFIYDMTMSKEAKPEDILLLDQKGIRQYIADEMKLLYQKNPEYYFKEEVDALQKLEFEYGYYLNHEGFVFFFQPYAVAPYVTGIVSIPMRYQDHPEWFRVKEPFQKVTA